MKIKSIFTVLCLMAGATTFAQKFYDYDASAGLLRKLVMQSDVILTSSRFHDTVEQNNDYLATEFYIIERINTLLVNKTQFKTNSKIRVQQRISDYSFFWNDKGGIVEAMDVPGIGGNTCYSDLFFLQKEGKQYKLLGQISNVLCNDMQAKYIPSVKQLEEIGKITSLPERYARSIDWFIAQNAYPDEYFTNFYRKAGITGDTLALTAQQVQKAKDGYFSGHEDLLPFVKDRFPLEIKKYRLEKLRKIKNVPKLDYSDYSRFQGIVEDMYDFEYGSLDYIALNILTTDEVSRLYGDTIMEYFINMVEKDIEQMENGVK